MFSLKKAKKGDTASEAYTVDIIIEQKAQALNAMDMAIESAVDMVAKTIAKCEFKVLRHVDGKLQEVRDRNYYRYNIKPNVNEKGFTFWRKVIHTLFYEGEALIITLKNGDMFLAESFTSSNDVIYKTIFRNVTIGANGNTIHLDRVFFMDEVLYLKNDNIKVINLMKSFNKTYADMLGMTVQGYRAANAPKYAYRSPNGNPMKKEGLAESNQMIEIIKSKLSSSNLEVASMGPSTELSLISDKVAKTTDDFIKLIDKAFDIVGFCFDIPLDVFIGKTTEKSNAQNDFITFAIDPYKEIIEDAINSSYVDEEEFLNGELIKIDTTRIKHYDILEVATNLDKLFAMGFSHNDICELIGKLPVDEPWANARYVTKNYEPQKGGENNGEILPTE